MADMTWINRPAVAAAVFGGVPAVVVGVPLVIWYIRDPQFGGPTPLWTGVGLILGAFLLSWWAMRSIAQDRTMQRLRVNGIAGQAQLLDVRQTGLTRNGQRLFKLVLQVTTPTHGTYDTTIKEYVPSFMSSRLRPGRRLNVRVDPEDRLSLLIVW